MTTARETLPLMIAAGPHWRVPLMDFVDDLRRCRDPRAVEEPFEPADPYLDPLLASVVEALCREMEWETPRWVDRVPSAPNPWFVSGMESLKAIALAESPASFRVRQIFVLENFLSRV